MTDTSNLNTVPVSADMSAAETERQAEIDAVLGGQEDPLATETIAQDAVELGQELEPEPRKPIQRSPADDRRLEIAAKFTRGEPRIFDGDMTNPENLYGVVARQPDAEVDPAPSIVGEPMVDMPEEKPAPQPKLVTIKVRGKDVTLTEQEILARASKVEAADTYLQEARDLLDKAKSYKAERAGRDPHHPEGQSSTQDDELDPDASDGRSHHPENETKAIIEKLQYGDPEEAAAALEAFVDKRAGQKAEQGHVERLFNNDLARSQKALKDFEAANAELANDKIASKIIEQNLYDIYREDLLALGLDEAKLPADSRELANWHRLQRVHGFAVKDIPSALNEAKARLDKWRGVSSAPKPQAAAKGAPRVEINVDRTERRAAIPNQPTRASLPQRAAAPVKPETRSDAVAEMRRARGQVQV